MGNGNDDRETFKALWTTWKAGKAKPEVEPEKMRLLATARKLLGEDVEGGCEASLRYLREAREGILRRVQEAAQQEGADPVRLLRGLRGGGADDLSFRWRGHTATGHLVSYATEMEGAMQFAALGSKPGLIYGALVPLNEIVFFESLDLCDAYPREHEVLVLHQTAPRDVRIERTGVAPRPRLGNLARQTHVPANVAVREAVRSDCDSTAVALLLPLPAEALDSMFGEGFRAGAAVTVLVDDAPVGIAIVTPADRSLSVYVAEPVHRAGLGELVARKALSLAFEHGLPDVTARARPDTSGARLAKKLKFTQTSADAGEVSLIMRSEDWRG